MLLAGSARADTKGFYLPTAPSGPGGTDTIESASGARCSQSINSAGAYFDVGVALGSDKSELDYSGSGDMRDIRDVTTLGYARLVVPLGKKPERLDCIRLYEMELQRLREEIKLMQMAIE